VNAGDARGHECGEGIRSDRNTLLVPLRHKSFRGAATGPASGGPDDRLRGEPGIQGGLFGADAPGFRVLGLRPSPGMTELRWRAPEIPIVTQWG
jgi:hypothetical protein